MIARRLPQSLAAVLFAVVLAAGAVPSAQAYNARTRIIDAELNFQGTWEETAFVTDAGATAYTAQAFLTVRITTAGTYKLLVWSGAEQRTLVSTQMTVTKAGDYNWTSASFGTQATPESLRAYAYYLSGSTFVEDDMVRGGLPLAHVWDVNNVGRWYPNQYSDVFFEYPTGYTRATQFFWWWDNSYWTTQKNGTTHLNRFKTWANRSDAWLWTIEFRRVSAKPTFPNLPADQEGWDFAKLCPDPHWSYYICGYNSWSSNIPGIRIGDVEEKQSGGNEEAQFEVDNEQVKNLQRVLGQDPHNNYPGKYYLSANFSLSPNGTKGAPVWVMTGMQLQHLGLQVPPGGDDYFFFLHASNTKI